jgi:hypothetical protein
MSYAALEHPDPHLKVEAASATVSHRLCDLPAGHADGKSSLRHEVVGNSSLTRFDLRYATVYGKGELAPTPL